MAVNAENAKEDVEMSTENSNLDTDGDALMLDASGNADTENVEMSMENGSGDVDNPKQDNGGNINGDSTEKVESGGAKSQAKKDKSGQNDTVDNECKMFVGGLSWQTTTPGLREYFEKFGEVKECTIKKGKPNKSAKKGEKAIRSRGFGFVLFAKKESVRKVLNKEEHYLDCKLIDPKRLQVIQKERKDGKIFVGGIKSEVDDDTVKAYFSKYGKIKLYERPTDKATGKNKGFCFITYKKDGSVRACTSAQPHKLGGKKVDVREADNQRTEHGAHRGAYGAMRGGGGVYGAMHGGGEAYGAKRGGGEAYGAMRGGEVYGAMRGRGEYPMRGGTSGLGGPPGAYGAMRGGGYPMRREVGGVGGPPGARFGYGLPSYEDLLDRLLKLTALTAYGGNEGYSGLHPGGHRGIMVRERMLEFRGNEGYSGLHQGGHRGGVLERETVLGFGRNEGFSGLHPGAQRGGILGREGYGGNEGYSGLNQGGHRGGFLGLGKARRGMGRGYRPY